MFDDIYSSDEQIALMQAMGAIQLIKLVKEMRKEAIWASK